MQLDKYFPRYFVVTLILYAAVLAIGVGFLLDLVRFDLFATDIIFSALSTIMILLPLILLIPYFKLWPSTWLRLLISFLVIVDALFLLLFVMPLQ